MSIVEKARIMKGWNRTDQEWARTARVSRSTLKRFLSGQSLTVDCFRSLCEALGLDEWQNLVAWEDNDSTRVAQKQSENPPAQPEPAEPKRTLLVTGFFNESQKARIEILLEGLKKTLLEADIIIDPTHQPKRTLLVTGFFNESQKARIEILLEGLKKTLLEADIIIIDPTH
ncbi:hypothetical protein [Coleofasciculus sp. E1-EBD-02]|uniref:hypothetical protein n=1 Tax=Coleofasciculus sp. E1-EBD-02 TaxID=3068481 RepID=UPI00330347A2